MADQLGPPQPQLAADVAPVRSHRVHREGEAFGDLAIAEPLADQSQHLLLPGRERSRLVEPLPQQLADVLTYVRNAFGNKAPAVKVEEVKAVRDATKGRTAPWTAAELGK